MAFWKQLFAADYSTPGPASRPSEVERSRHGRRPREVRPSDVDGRLAAPVNRSVALRHGTQAIASARRTESAARGSSASGHAISEICGDATPDTVSSEAVSGFLCSGRERGREPTRLAEPCMPVRGDVPAGVPSARVMPAVALILPMKSGREVESASGGMPAELKGETTPGDDRKRTRVNKLSRPICPAGFKTAGEVVESDQRSRIFSSLRASRMTTCTGPAHGINSLFQTRCRQP
jgi:hypothetical protein